MKQRPDPQYPSASRATTFQDGLEFQDWVCMVLARHGVVLQNLSSKRYQIEIGENLQGFEIKYDARCTGDGGTEPTNQLSIEVAEKSRAENPDWIPSGIMRDDNAWLYIQGNYQRLWIFAKNWLRRYYRKKRPVVRESFGTVQKFYLPIAAADQFAVRVFSADELGRVAA